MAATVPPLDRPDPQNRCLDRYVVPAEHLFSRWACVRLFPARNKTERVVPQPLGLPASAWLCDGARPDKRDVDEPSRSFLSTVVGLERRPPCQRSANVLPIIRNRPPLSSGATQTTLPPLERSRSWLYNHRLRFYWPSKQVHALRRGGAAASGANNVPTCYVTMTNPSGGVPLACCFVHLVVHLALVVRARLGRRTRGMADDEA